MLTARLCLLRQANQIDFLILMKNNILFQRYPDLARAFEEVLDQVKQFSRPANERILDDVELCDLLRVSKRTTATWRQKRLIKHSWLQGKCYYRYSDVLDAIEQNAVTPLHLQLKIKL